MSSAEQHHHRDEALDLEGLKAWAQPLLDLHVWCRREHGQWYMLAEEFDITGMGETKEDAYYDMVGLLGAYFVSHYADGSSFEDALRPIPLKLKLQIRSQVSLSRAISPLAKLISGTPTRNSREYSTLISADSVLQAIHC